VELRSRNNKDFTRMYPSIAAMGTRLNSAQVVLDGEITRRTDDTSPGWHRCCLNATANHRGVSIVIQMLQLTVLDGQGGSELFTSSMYFRITGNAIWTRPGDQPTPIRYTQGGWMYGTKHIAGVRIEGKCRLVFGISSEPASVSEILQSVSFDDRTLYASGIPFAIYDVSRDSWRGVAGNLWWQAFRVDSAELRDAEQAKGLIHLPNVEPVGGPEHS
jgi:hypothetical protein